MGGPAATPALVSWWLWTSSRPQKDKLGPGAAGKSRSSEGELCKKKEIGAEENKAIYQTCERPETVLYKEQKGERAARARRIGSDQMPGQRLRRPSDHRW